MNILFTLCGRAGSKGVAGKNVRNFLDVPLAWLSLAACKLYEGSPEGKGHHIDIVVNTDSEQLIEITTRIPGVEVNVIQRDESLAGDKVRKVDVIRDCLTRMQTKKGINYDLVVDLDITSPLRRVKDINNAISTKAARNDTDVVFSVTPSRRQPEFNMVTKKGEFYSVALPGGFATRQDAPRYFDMNASIYAYSPDALLHKDAAKMFASGCDVIVMPDTAVLDIDSEDDYKMMQVIAEYLYKADPDYGAIYAQARKWLQAEK